MKKEYKFITGNTSDVQKTLNQWRHEFVIEVLQMSTYDTAVGPHVMLLVTRLKQK